MNLDIRTLAIALGIINVLQIIGFTLQYLTNKSWLGIGWWLMWSMATALGFLFMLLRDVVPVEWIATSIFLTNILLFTGHGFLYTGIMRFLDRKENREIIIATGVIFILSTFFVIYLNPDDQIRPMILYGGAAIISFMAARELWVYKTHSIHASANFLAVIFIIHGFYFCTRIFISLTVFPVGDVFAPTVMQTATFMIPLVTNYLWAFGLIIMINQRSHAEMGQSREHFEMIFNTGPDAVLITRMDDGRLFAVNDAFSTITGFARSEIIGKSTLEFPVWRNHEDREKVISELDKTGCCDNLEIVFQRKDGSRFSGILSAKLITMKGQTHIISVVRDITDRMQAEASLRNSEEKFRLLVENSHDIIYSLTADGVFIFVSPAWTTLLGHPPTDVVGKTFQSFVHPDDIPECMAFLKSVIGTGKRKEGIEYRVSHMDGSWYWHTSSAVPFQDDAGRIVGFYGIAKDITQRRKREADMKELISSLQTALEEIKTLKGIVPICANCKKIRDDQGYWEQVEAYVSRHTEAQFSHSICPDCIKKLYPEFCMDESE